MTQGKTGIPIRESHSTPRDKWIVLSLNSLRRRLDRTKEGDLTDQRKDQLSKDFDGNIETGFQIATFQGPLCAEPVEGVAFFVQAVEIDREGVEKERRTYSLPCLAIYVLVLMPDLSRTK